MKILVVDEHVLIRASLRGVLTELKGETAVIVEAPDSRQAMRLIEQNPDVELVLLDLALPDRDGLETLAEIAERYPAVSVVALSVHQDDTIIKALNLGARGFIPKSAAREVMLDALNLILSGGIYIPPEILNLSDADRGLTEQQIDVLTLMMQGKSSKEISRALDLAETTVKKHIAAILRILRGFEK